MTSSVDRSFSAGAARGAAGALIFSLPIMMTMEMWWLGFYLEPFRISALLLATLPVLLGLAHFVGFRQPGPLTEDVIDVLVALLIGAATAAAGLYVLGLLHSDVTAREAVSKIVLQTIPASIGALLARSQITGSQSSGESQQVRNASYGGELFLMAAGALFLSLNLAPTEEIVVIAYQLGPWQDLSLLVFSVIVMHVIVYWLNSGGGELHSDHGFFSLFANYTVTGYAIVLVASLFVLWAFGRIDGDGFEHIMSKAIVLSFPGAIGAAATRAIL